MPYHHEHNQNELIYFVDFIVPSGYYCGDHMQRGQMLLFVK